VALYGIAIAASTLIAFTAASRWLDLGVEQATTVSFLTIALCQLWHVFNMRSRRSSLWRNDVIENRLIWYALALCLCLIVMAINVPVLATALELAPIGTKGWTLALACSLMPLVGGQIWLGLSRGHAPAHATGTVMPRQGRLE
jgi:Ca2+-transporting ATPase